MTCHECELRLTTEENVDEHLAECASCRSLAEELRANSAAFESFADDPLPSVRNRVMARIERPRMWRWAWALAAAASIAIAIFEIPRKSPETPAVPPVQVAQTQQEPPVASPIAKPRPARKIRKQQPAQPLMVKMLTSDPDVVIYWQIESEDQ